MKFRKRIERLEKIKGGAFEPLVLYFGVRESKGEVRVTGARGNKSASGGFAIIGGSPQGESAQLNFKKDETDADKKEKIRITLLPHKIKSSNYNTN